MNHQRAHRITHLLVAAILGIAAFTLVLMATDPPGPGLDPDAMAYMGAAESVAHEARFRVPAEGWEKADSTAALSHFPPGYSIALALPVRLGMAAPQAARLVDALAAAVTVGTLVLLLAAATASLPAGAVLGVALMVTPALALVHLSVLSEPLFLACTALVLAAMARRDARPLAIGTPAALGALTRYAGLSLVGAAVLWSVAMPGTLRERMRRGLLALLPAALLQGAWIIRTRLLHGQAEIRHIAFYGRLGPTIAHAGGTLRDWLVPDPDAWSDPFPYHARIAGAVALLLVLLMAEGVRRALEARRAMATTGDAPRGVADPAVRLMAASALIASCYIGMLVASRLFADPGIPFDERILAPFFLVATVGTGAVMAQLWRASGGMMFRVAIGLTLLCWGVASAWTTWGAASYAMEWGSDFAGEQWRRSEVLEWGRTAGATHPLYTNWPSAVYFHLHRPSRYVPSAVDAGALDAFADTLRAHDGRALVFSVGEADYLSANVMLHARGLRVVAALEDGVVLAAAR